MPEPIKTKRCSSCKSIKPVSGFYKRQTAVDGLRGQCTACERAYSQTEDGKDTRRRYDQSVKGRIAQKRYQQSGVNKNRQKRYRQTEKGKACEKRRNQSKAGIDARDKYYRKNSFPEKRKARSFLNHAVETGKIPRISTLQCTYCPTGADHYHHHKGYARKHWLDVIPVCMGCHKTHHIDLLSPVTVV